MRSRAPEHPATTNGGLQTGRYLGDTKEEEQENMHIGNLDIWISVEKTPAERPRQRRETEQEDAEAGEERSEGTREERSHPD
ncbi:hypothetical protein NDU88_003658 [Pleurodeles waltl]|uniref:Uncharacterized protein n=1 Tax=Pleurodeles waltl TaxID=8319 RepID=A0AAV7UGR6_PLEWA|nr:hypothetical protein NDU88_003658 [Pleurodeles waltl]